VLGEGALLYGAGYAHSQGMRPMAFVKYRGYYGRASRVDGSATKRSGKLKGGNAFVAVANQRRMSYSPPSGRFVTNPETAGLMAPWSPGPYK
jgi:hypothetical protein